VQNRKKRMSEFEVWLYRGCIVILLGVLWYLAKGVLKELKLIRGTLQALQLAQARQDGQIKLVSNTQESHEKRINDHAERLRDIERKQDSCKNCNT
jgi:hypothetical protein